MLKAIIFDFDGVIVESIDVKKEAFRRLFENYPQHINQIVEYHMRNGGISRFVKFEYIYREIFKKELTEEESQRLGREFSENAVEGVITSPFVKGALEFLEKYHKDIKCFVASGTPQDEMELVVDRRGLNQYFCGVYGSPTAKADIAREILRKYPLRPQEVLFVGDSINDFEGAQKVGVPFIGRIHPQYPSPFEGVLVKSIVRDLFELDEWVRTNDLAAS
jgi:HAD superfamily hydrolase (TIGR01549 family)